MSWEHRHDLRSQDPGVWELCWWKGKYICTQSSASLAVALHWVSPIIQAPSRRPASWEVRGQSGCWAADSIPMPAGRPGQAFQGGSWIQSWWVGSGRSSLWARSPHLLLLQQVLPSGFAPSPLHSPHPHDTVMEVASQVPYVWDYKPWQWPSRSNNLFYSDTLFLLFQETLLV